MYVCKYVYVSFNFYFLKITFLKMYLPIGKAERWGQGGGGEGGVLPSVDPLPKCLQHWDGSRGLNPGVPGG